MDAEQGDVVAAMPGAAAVGAAPSPQGQPPTELTVRPFRGLRFSPEFSDRMHLVTCPPYDVLGPAGIAAFQQLDPQNVVRIVLPGLDAEAHMRAAATMQQWQQGGTLIQDDADSLYVLDVQVGSDRCLGVIGVVSLHEPATGVVVPHEQVFAGPVADRAGLMEATQAQLEPILLLTRADGALDAASVTDAARARDHDQLLRQITSTPPTVQATTALGQTHQLWQVSDPEVIERLQVGVQDAPLLIADGHHRWAATREVAAQNASVSGCLAVVIDVSTSPLALRAIHRAIPNLTLEQIAEVHPGWTSMPLDEPSTSPVPGQLFITNGAYWLKLERQAVDTALTGVSALDVAALHEQLIPTWADRFGATEVTFIHGTEEALEWAHAGNGAVILLAPPTVDEVLRLSTQGLQMPHKATSFGPKPRSGLVMRLLADM